MQIFTNIYVNVIEIVLGILKFIQSPYIYRKIHAIKSVFLIFLSFV